MRKTKRKRLVPRLGPPLNLRRGGYHKRRRKPQPILLEELEF